MQFLRVNQLQLLVLLASAAVILYLLLAVIGGVNGYSVVPHWDMWDGYLDFYTRLRDGDYSVWWTQHNEHRILLARQLFYIDIRFFDGSGVFLVVMNYVLVLCAFTLFVIILREHMQSLVSGQCLNQLQTGTHDNLLAFHVILLMLTTMLFSWIQYNNFVFGFQSQFFLAQLLPLVAFYLLHRSNKAGHANNIYFMFAVISGALSAGTIASGILVMPLMTVLAMVYGMSRIKILILFALSPALLYAYFDDYMAPPHHGSVVQTITEQPIELARYVLTYLGGPFYYLLGKSIVVAQLFGLVFLVASFYKAFQTLCQCRPSSLQFALLTFILYVSVTALGTGGGRLIFGMEQAVSSRYMTPALMAWSTLLVLYSGWINDLFRKHPKRFYCSFLIIIGLFFFRQLPALQSQADTNYERMIAALALELRVKDQQQVAHVYPSVDRALTISEVPAEQNLSIFNHPAIRDIRESIGMHIPLEQNSGTQCIGHLDAVEHIPGESRFVRIRGWMFNSSQGRVPEVIDVTDSSGTVVGYAIVGQHRPDVANAIDDSAKHSGFKGYLLTTSPASEISLVSRDRSCLISATL